MQLPHDYCMSNSLFKYGKRNELAITIIQPDKIRYIFSCSLFLSNYQSPFSKNRFDMLIKKKKSSKQIE